jgi:hypothetical protein
MPRARSLSTVARVMSAKAECLWKPAQSGKTRTIQEIIRADDGVRNHLNILVCSNNRLLVAQTKVRMVDGVYAADDAASETSGEENWDGDDRIDNGVYSWMSGTKKTNISTRDLAMRVVLGEVSMIVCCSHKARFRYLAEMLEILERAMFMKPVNVWIDEADVSVKHWSGAYDFTSFACVRKMTLVSATFDSVFDHYGRIRVMPFPETHPECYVGLRDCSFVAMDDAEGAGAASYVETVLSRNPELLRPGAKLFVPGDIERTTHDAIAKYLTARGAIVLVLNGLEKAFRFPDGTTVPIALKASDETPDELSQVLAAKYKEYGMDKYPVAVTGQLCLGRGITFQSRDFTFDYAIIPTIRNAAAAYQCVARVLGNIRDFSPWTPVVYMASALLEKVKRQERIAMNLARLVHQNKWVDVSRVEVGLAGEETVSHLEEFSSMDDLRSRWAEIIRGADETTRRHTPHTPHQKDGVYVCSIGAKSEKQAAEDIRSKFPNGSGTANWGSGITDAVAGEYVHRVYAGYEPDTSAVFFLRWAQKGQGAV